MGTGDFGREDPREVFILGESEHQGWKVVASGCLGWGNRREIRVIFRKAFSVEHVCCLSKTRGNNCLEETCMPEDRLWEMGVLG